MRRRPRTAVRCYRGTDFVVTKLIRTIDDQNPFFFVSVDGVQVTELHTSEEDAVNEFKSQLDELFEQASPDPTTLDLHSVNGTGKPRNLH